MSIRNLLTIISAFYTTRLSMIYSRANKLGLIQYVYPWPKKFIRNVYAILISKKNQLKTTWNRCKEERSDRIILPISARKGRNPDERRSSRSCMPTRIKSEQKPVPTKEYIKYIRCRQDRIQNKHRNLLCEIYKKQYPTVLLKPIAMLRPFLITATYLSGCRTVHQSIPKVEQNASV